MEKTINQTLDLSGKENHHFIVYKIGNDRRPNRQVRIERRQRRKGKKAMEIPKVRGLLCPLQIKQTGERSYPIGNQVKGRKECDRGGMS